MGSPTAFADEKCEMRLRTKANSGPHGLYVPAGAFWGGEDVRKMADRGTLKVIHITLYRLSLTDCNEASRVSKWRYMYISVTQTIIDFIKGIF